MISGDDFESMGKRTFGRTWRTELARELGVSVRTVTRWKESGVEGRDRERRVREICAAGGGASDSVDALLLDLVALASKMHEIAKQLSHSRLSPGRESGVEPKNAAPSVQASPKSKSPLKPGMSNDERRAIYGVRGMIGGETVQRAPYERQSVFILTNQFPPGRHAISTVVSKAGPEWAKMADGMPVREYLRDFLDGMNRAFERGDYVESALDDLGKVRVESGFLVIDP